MKTLPSDYIVKVTGHSLGAALAELAAMDLIHAGY
jgi:putative lipase involved disintegration of autophagic bodies